MLDANVRRAARLVGVDELANTDRQNGAAPYARVTAPKMPASRTMQAGLHVNAFVHIASPTIRSHLLGDCHQVREQWRAMATYDDMNFSPFGIE